MIKPEIDKMTDSTEPWQQVRGAGSHPAVPSGAPVSYGSKVQVRAGGVQTCAV